MTTAPKRRNPVLLMISVYFMGVAMASGGARDWRTYFGAMLMGITIGYFVRGSMERFHVQHQNRS